MSLLTVLPCLHQAAALTVVHIALKAAPAALKVVLARQGAPVVLKAAPVR